MYLCISAVVLIFSIRLFRRASGTLNLQKLNMISWIFYYDLILQSFISAILVVYSIDDHYLISKISNPSARLYGYAAIMYTMLLMPAGMVSANKIWGGSPKILFKQYTEAPIVSFISRKDSYIRYPLYLLSMLGVFGVIYTYIQMREIPFLALLKGEDKLGLTGLREEVGRDFQGNVVFRNVFGIVLNPIMTYVSFAYYRMTKSREDKRWFLLMLIFSILILTYNIAKAPLVLFLLGFVFFRILEVGQIKRKILVLTGLSAIAIIAGLYAVISFLSIEEIFSLRYGMGGRILLSQSAGIYLSFDTFPSNHDFLGFSSFSDYVAAFGLQPNDRSARILMETYFPKATQAGMAGVQNSLFIAEAWANFGFVGLAIAPFYVGFLIQSMYLFFLKSKKTPVLLGLFTYFSWKSSVGGGFNDYIYNPGFLTIMIIIGISVLLAKHWKRTIA